MKTRSTTALRATFAARMAAIYGEEVPAYTTLVDVSEAVNADALARDPEKAHSAAALVSVPMTIAGGPIEVIPGSRAWPA